MGPAILAIAMNQAEKGVVMNLRGTQADGAGTI
jgi:hypothetical protein